MPSPNTRVMQSPSLQNSQRQQNRMSEREVSEVNVVRWSGMSQEQRREALQLWHEAIVVSVNPTVRRGERAVMDMDFFGRISQYVMLHWNEPQVIANAMQRQIAAPSAHVLDNVEAQMQWVRVQRPEEQSRLANFQPQAQAMPFGVREAPGAIQTFQDNSGGIAPG